MKKYYLLKILYLIFCISLVSCATTNSFSSKQTIHGLITDTRGEGVANYSIVNTNKKILGSTDERGYFHIELDKTSHKIFSGFKQNWESIHFDFSKISENKLYIVQIKNASELKKEFEDFLLQNNYHEAENTILKCEESGIKDSELCIYKSILAYKKGCYSEAKTIIETLNNKDTESYQSTEFNEYKKLVDSRITTINQKEGDNTK